MSEIDPPFTDIICTCETGKCNHVLDRLYRTCYSEDNSMWYEYLDQLIEIYKCTNQDCISKTMIILNMFIDYNNKHCNRCLICDVDMGASNPRQYCGKTRCLQYN